MFIASFAAFNYNGGLAMPMIGTSLRTAVASLAWWVDLDLSIGVNWHIVLLGGAGVMMTAYCVLLSRLVRPEHCFDHPRYETYIMDCMNQNRDIKKANIQVYDPRYFALGVLRKATQTIKKEKATPTSSVYEYQGTQNQQHEAGGLRMAKSMRNTNHYLEHYDTGFTPYNTGLPPYDTNLT